MKRRAALWLVLVLCLLAACGQKGAKEILRYDLAVAPDTLDPQYAASEAARVVLANTFEGLVGLSLEGRLQPGCAERWELSGDSLTWTFFLRDGLKWSDGGDLTAQDFVFGLQRLFAPAGGASLAQDFLSLQNAAEILEGELPASALGVFAPDPKTVVIRLARAEPSLPWLLAQPAALPCPEAFFVEQKGRYGLRAEQLLCNGPYVVGSWSKTSIGLRVNPHFDRPAQNLGVNLYFGRGDAVDLFLKGESDLCLIPFHRMEQAQGLDGETLLQQSWALLFNAQSGAFSHRQIRAAFVGALDTAQLRGRLDGDVSPPGGLIPPGATIGGSFYRALAGDAQPAPEVASPRAILMQALEQENLKSLPRMTLLVGDFAPGPAMGGAMQRQWQQTLSAFVNMEQQPFETLLARVETGLFDLAVVPLTAQGGTAFDCFSRLAPQDLSESGALGALLDSARQQSDLKAAAADLRAAEQRLLDGYLALPLFDAPSLFVQREGISGARYCAASQTIYFANAQSGR